MISSRCSHCLWWDNQHKSLEGLPQTMGYCRKHHPIVFSREGRYYGGWPLVDENDLCGEFREDNR
jgi:hypothetical protein